MSPKELVSGTVKSKNKTWFAKLSDKDAKYIREVVSEMMNAPESKFHSVASALVLELNLSVCAATVDRTLRKLSDEAKRKKTSK